MNRLKLGLSVAGAACAGFALAAIAQPAPPSGAPGAPGAERPGMGHTLTREEAKAQAELLFSRLDLNKDGKLDTADRDARASQMFDAIDSNHDGAISRAEFLAAHKQGEARSDPAPGAPAGADMMRTAMHERAMGLAMQILHEADPQHTGVVSHEAFIAASLALFDKADTNHDGKVSPEERRAAMPAHGMDMGMGRGMGRGGRMPRDHGGMGNTGGADMGGMPDMPDMPH